MTILPVTLASVNPGRRATTLLDKCDKNVEQDKFNYDMVAMCYGKYEIVLTIRDKDVSVGLSGLLQTSNPFAEGVVWFFRGHEDRLCAR